MTDERITELNEGVSTESMSGLQRTHYCGELKEKHNGEQVVLMGWVQRRRDHGGLIFIDLRDKTGLVQVVFSPELYKNAFNKAQTVRSEYVLALRGSVRMRPDGTENPKLDTGQIEVLASEIRVLNRAKTPPFYIENNVEVEENLRLRYRYLDLRRPEMQEALFLRHRAARSVRNFLDSQQFVEIETPILTKSTPEGARDYLVPSRVNPGKFYALPQSPQLYKQILMVAGYDKYYQIVRCFRDEDLRADRQPEFTQIDLEMSFVDVDDVLAMTEEMIVRICRESVGLDVYRPFPRMSYAEAIERYGTDKPDTRFGMELIDISDIAGNCDFKVFAAATAAGGKVKGIKASSCGNFSRREIEELIDYVSIYKAKGLAYFTVEGNGLKSAITKFFSERELNEIQERMMAEPGDLLLFVADKPNVVASSLGALRLYLGERMGIIPGNKYNLVWILDFPLLDFDEAEGRYIAMHHPFTSPKEEDMHLLGSDPGKVLARAYDLVLNGVEIGGGSIRIHIKELQEKIFSVIGIEKEEAIEKFGFLLEAFDYGTPPHGGIAIGFDRLLMILAGKNSIRDLIAFPKTQSATELMTLTPAEVSPEQIRELHLKTVDRKKQGR